MAETRARYIPPAIDQVSFNCPHCGALAKQFWYILHADSLAKDATPTVLDPERVKELTFEKIEDREEQERMRKWVERMAKGRPFLERGEKYCNHRLQNFSLSLCYSCNDMALWLYDRLIWPQRGEAPPPNPDLPDDIRRDYDEASSIIDLSPRGAAALLRLSIQKLCKELGERGKSIDDDIASLVKKGLDARVQQALDVVRVVGNNAVHPGQINLSDDRAAAENLFGLVNLIAEAMITQPKHVQEMFEALPEGARKAIEKRDGG